MVKALHRAGIEVILDVVYNHTAEGNQLGPMLSFKGVDNATYYRLVPDDPRCYMDFTGTGNSPERRAPERAAADHGLAALLGHRLPRRRVPLRSGQPRSPASSYDVDRLSAFFDVIHQDPVLSQVKLIAEPWDVGPGGYQVGNFPILWTEWNGIYRDAMRDFWRGDARRRPSSPTASPDRATCTSDDGRRPSASINFVTAHDGFTLADLVSYNEKHNEANLEDNRDGTDDNRSLELRRRGPDRRPRDRRAARPPAAQPARPRCCCPRACRCCSAATRSAGPRAATTTPGARTTRSPGSTGTSTTRPGSCSRSPGG